MEFNYQDTTIDAIKNVKFIDESGKEYIVKKVYCETADTKTLVYEKSSILVAGTSTGLWYSEDMGAKWTQSNITSGIFGNPNNKSDEVGYGNIVYSPLYKKFFAHANSGSKNYLYISEDGKTWTTLLPSNGATKYWTDLQVSKSGYIFCSGANSDARTGHVYYYDKDNGNMKTVLNGVSNGDYHYLLKDKVSNICYIYDILYGRVYELLDYNAPLKCGAPDIYRSQSHQIGYLADGILMVSVNDYDPDEGYDDYVTLPYNIIEKKALPSLTESWNDYKEFYENGLHIITSKGLTRTWYAQTPFSSLPATSVKNYFDNITSYKTDDDVVHFLLKKGNYIYNTTSLGGTWTQELNVTNIKLPTEVKNNNVRYLLYPATNKLYVRDITNNGTMQEITTTFGTGYQIVANQ